MKKLTMVDAFCGCGGMGLGLTEAGFDSVCAFDINGQAVETHRMNFKSPCHVKDVRKLSGSFLLKNLEMKVGQLDLFAGGPPCQGFSKQRKNADGSDTRNDLVIEFSRIVHEVKPKSFVFENVKVFGQARGRKYVKEMKDLFDAYVLYPHFYNCVDYEMAQTRERFILVGVRKDIPIKFSIPEKHLRHVNIKDIIGDLPSPPSDFTEHPEFKNHIKNKITETNRKRISFVPQGGGWQDIPYKYRWEAHKKVDVSKGGWPDVFGRLSWKGVCPTITGGFDSFTRGRYAHPSEDRAITAREAARLQGFPDWFEFLGTKKEVCKQIGNAVPPPLARAVGDSLAEVLLKYYQHRRKIK